MVPLQPFLSSFLFLLWLLPRSATSSENCPVSYCGSVTVKSPFQLITSGISSSDDPRCGYPGFQLDCNYFLNETLIILFPNSGPFIVDDIIYDSRTLIIRDPFNCLLQRFLHGFTVGPPFVTSRLTNFTLLNCSSDTTASHERFRTIACLSGENHTVVAIPSPRRSYDESDLPSSCIKIRTISVPLPWGFRSGDLEDDLQLTWKEPPCGYCEQRGQACGSKTKNGLEVGCSDLQSSGMLRGTKYAIIIGVGIPGALCIIGLGFFLGGRVRAYGQRPHLPNTESSNAVSVTQPAAVVLIGLDGPTIESYPKTLLGESGRLPKPSDNICPICLCEYQPKETLRTIPECNHYFHANCIDEWLRMNASCPLCRNSPDINGSSTSTSSRSSSLLSP